MTKKVFVDSDNVISKVAAGAKRHHLNSENLFGFISDCEDENNWSTGDGIDE